jgi:hypothetical protein
VRRLSTNANLRWLERLFKLDHYPNLQYFRADGADRSRVHHQLRARGTSIEEPAIEGAVLRLRPIMMTQTLVQIGANEATLTNVHRHMKCSQTQEQ